MIKTELIFELEQVINNKKRNIEALKNKNVSINSRKYKNELTEYYFFNAMIEIVKRKAKTKGVHNEGNTI